MRFKRDIGEINTHVLNTIVLYRVAGSDTLHNALLGLRKFQNQAKILTES